jgi:PBP1b-binding outer membrane lipoprotein LpoB
MKKIIQILVLIILTATMLSACSTPETVTQAPAEPTPLTQATSLPTPAEQAAPIAPI